MHQSLQQTAQLTMNMSADATALLEYRRKIKARGKDLGLPDITVTDLIALAVAKTLPSFPELNCLYKDDKLLRYAHVHLAMAVDTPRGLMVPVVRFADRFGLADLAVTLKDLARQCKEGSINPDLLTGGTITITNLGMFGVETFTPILNPPQVAIVGVCATVPKPAVNDKGGYEIRPHVGISLTIDHRVVDGAPGARFLKTLCDNIANIDFMLSVW
jgi:pyruvate dehydrogenase E2 component (dihydrolipoamide acetyltransferase)